MSPYIRSMLEDAADDSERPIATDLAQIRAAGRRAVWRQRGLVGAGGLGVVAVVASVALVLPSISGTPGGPAGPAGSPAASGSESVWGAATAASFGLTPAVEPLFEAIAAAGYEVGGDGEHGLSAGSSVMSEGSASSTEMLSMTMTSLPVKKDDAVGSLIVAEFTDVKMLDPGGGAGQDPQCAISPSELGSIEFAWSECDKESSGEVQVWRASGGSPEGDAIGVTVVRADFSGVSLTLSTASDGMVVSGYDLRPNPDSGSRWFGANTPPATAVAIPAPSLTVVPETLPDRTELPLPELSPVDELATSEPVVPENLPALSELPLTVDALAEFVVNIAASGTVFAEGSSGDGAPSDGLPPPNDPAARAACIEGEVLTEMVDDAGRSALVRADDRIYACSWGVEPDELVDVMNVTDWTAFGDELAAWQFNLGYLTVCERLAADGQLQLCPDDVRMGVGPVPDGVARISFELPDGEVLDAHIAAGFWIFRTVQPSESPGDPAPIIVRVYDADGGVLAEGDINIHPPMPPDWPGSSPLKPPPGPPPTD